MQWFAGNMATAIVLGALIAVVAVIIRGLVRGRCRCDGCSGECSSCGDVCAACTIELTPEQLEKLDALSSGEGRNV